MEIINRHQKIEHVSANPEPANAYFLDDYLISQNNISFGDKATANYEETSLSTLSNPKLTSFRLWVEHAPVAKELLGQGSSLDQLLPAYGEAVVRDHEEIQKLVPKLHQRFEERLLKLVEKGHLPKIYKERFTDSKSVGPAKVNLYDTFAASYLGQNITLATPAFYDPDEHEIYLRAFEGNAPLTRHFVHEETHRDLSGITTHKNDRKIYTSRLGFSTHVVGEKGRVPKSAQHRILNEATTEYITNLMVYGKPGKISPESRDDNHDTGVYVPERQILEIIANRVGVDTLLNAYAEDYTPGQPDTMRYNRKLMSKIREAYGPGFLHKLDKVDQEKGVKSALSFVRSADYLADNRRLRANKKINRALTLLGLRV